MSNDCEQYPTLNSLKSAVETLGEVQAFLQAMSLSETVRVNMSPDVLRSMAGSVGTSRWYESCDSRSSSPIPRVSSMTFLDPLTEAKRLATHHHVEKGGHTYGVLPYTHHLADVENVMRRFGIDDDTLLIGAWLHDILEDCEEVKPKHIEEMFNSDRLVQMVMAVTDEPGPNRKTRKALTYPKIRKSQDARILKLADRIANVEAGGSLVQMYKKEYEEFRINLRLDGLLRDDVEDEVFERNGTEYEMWRHLDDLMGWRWK